MVFLIALACGMLWGVCYIVRTIIQHYSATYYSTGNTIAIVIVNVILFGVCFCGALAIDMSIGMAFMEWLIFGVIGNIITIVIINIVNNSDYTPPTNANTPKTTEDKIGTIEWDEEDE